MFCFFLFLDIFVIIPYLTNSLWTVSGGDSSARPKNYKFQPPKDIEAALNELEKQEKAFEKELKKLAPKKDRTLTLTL